MTDVDEIIGRFQKPVLMGEGKWSQSVILDLLASGNPLNKTDGRDDLAKSMTELHNTNIQVEDAQLFENLPADEEVDDLTESKLKDDIIKEFEKKKEELGIESDLRLVEKIMKWDTGSATVEKLRKSHVTMPRKIKSLLTQTTTKEIQSIARQFEARLPKLTTSFFTRKIRESDSVEEIDEIIREARESGLPGIGIESLGRIKEFVIESGGLK